MQRLSVFWANLHKRVLGSFGGMYFRGKLGLYRKPKSVFNGRFMAFNDTTFAFEVQSSYGFNLLQQERTVQKGPNFLIYINITLRSSNREKTVKIILSQVLFPSLINKRNSRRKKNSFPAGIFKFYFTQGCV